jgi:hypothetical protein
VQEKLYIIKYGNVSAEAFLNIKRGERESLLGQMEVNPYFYEGLPACPNKDFYLIKMNKEETHYCKCGCGQIAKSTYLRGHSTKGRKWTEEQKKKASIRFSGNNNPCFGKPRSEESKKHHSEVMKGKKKGVPRPDWVKEKIRKGLLGTKLSEERKRHISEATKGRKGYWTGKTGIHSKQGLENIRNNALKYVWDKNPNWKGGTSRLPYGAEFTNKLKLKIKKRDKHTCQYINCVVYGNKNLDVHHIDYNKHNNKETNLISLCKSHHSKTNGHRIFWKLFYSTMINDFIYREQKYA